jgi:hypothetical protein
LILLFAGWGRFSEPKELERAGPKALATAERWLPREPGERVVAATPARLFLGDRARARDVAGTLAVTERRQAFLTEPGVGCRVLWLADPLAMVDLPEDGLPWASPDSERPRERSMLGRVGSRLLQDRPCVALGSGALRLLVRGPGRRAAAWLQSSGRLAEAASGPPAGPAAGSWLELGRAEVQRSRLRLRSPALRQGLGVGTAAGLLAGLLLELAQCALVGAVAAVLHALALWLRERARPVRYLGALAATALAGFAWAGLLAQAAYSEHLASTGSPGGPAWEAAWAGALELVRVDDVLTVAFRGTGWGAVLGAGVAVAVRARVPLAGAVVAALLLPALVVPTLEAGFGEFLEVQLNLLVGGLLLAGVALWGLGALAERVDRWLVLRRELDPPPSFWEVLRSDPVQGAPVDEAGADP